MNSPFKEWWHSAVQEPGPALLASVVDSQATVESWVRAGCPPGPLITYVNLFSYSWMRRAPGLYHQFDLITLDGIALVVLLRTLFPGSTFERRSPDMTSLVRDVLVLNGHRSDSPPKVFLLGGEPGVADQARARLSKEIPCAEFVGTQDGYFRGLDAWADCARRIRDCDPDLVLVGMGTPTQDLAAADLRRRGVRGTIMTCGGFLHQSARQGNYYPPMIDRLHLRWAYRAVQEPHVRRRLLKHYPAGLRDVLADYRRVRYRHGSAPASRDWDRD